MGRRPRPLWSIINFLDELLCAEVPHAARKGKPRPSQTPCTKAHTFSEKACYHTSVHHKGGWVEKRRTQVNARLTYFFNGRHMRLTDVHGKVVHDIIA